MSLNSNVNPDAHLNTNLNARLNVCVLIAVAMIMGMVLFCLVLYVVAQNQPAFVGTPFVSVVLAGVSAVVFLAAVLVPFLMTTVKRNSLRNSQNVAEQELLGFYQTRLIITLGILEGAIALNMVAYLLEQQDWSLVIAAGLVLAMVIHFPTSGRVNHWIKEQMELLAFEN